MSTSDGLSIFNNLMYLPPWEFSSLFWISSADSGIFFSVAGNQ
jgi:hypothetical protein